jgi:hypothetical protein
MPAVSGLEQEFPGQVKAQNVDASAPESEKAIKSLGFKSHGLVIRATNGKVLWKQPDHEVKIEDVREAVSALLKGQPLPKASKPHARVARHLPAQV